MAAVAQGTVAAVFAAAEVRGAIFFCFEANRRKVRSLVRTIAEGLVFALAAGTPKIGFSGFDSNGIRGALADGGVAHGDGKSYYHANEQASKRFWICGRAFISGYPPS